MRVLPEHRMGAALRSARQASGVSLREMARRLNYGSHSTLSEYENGVRMPSEAVVEGYERLLSLRVGSLANALEAANLERHGDAWARRRIHLPPHRPTTDTVAASPWPRQPVADGSDPDAAGCSVDAVTLHARRVALFHKKIIIGQIELRHSARAGAMWGRFEGYSYLDHLAAEREEVHVIVRIRRDSDGSAIATNEQYCFDYAWSDLLVADHGSFQAGVTVVVGADAIAAGETDCLVAFEE